MSATPERKPEPLAEPAGDEADPLRALVDAMLSGTYREEFYLWDVASLCRSKPEFARQLLALIDRYQRLGQMPAAQHRRIRQRIESSVTWSDERRPVGRGPCGEAQRGASPDGAARAASGPTQDAWPAALADLTMTTPLPAAPAVAASAAPDTPAAPAALDAPDTPAASAASAAPAGGPGVMAAAPGPGGVLRGRYELQSLLGSGGMASVYKAVDRYRSSLGLEDCYVAIKIVNAQRAQPAAVTALGREFHHAQRLSHPNVVNVYEIDHEGEASFYTMELLEGERLSQLCERIGGALPPRQALAIIRDIGSAIAHAHSRAVVHGDLKPHNIFVTVGGQIRVLDFGGLSPSLPEVREGEPTLDGEPRGYRAATPAYASCEQLEGRRAEPSDDIYALACIAYELFTGQHPYEGKSSLGARAQRLRPRRPHRLGARGWLALRRALSWQRERRPAQIGPWLERLGVAAAVEHLPPSYQLRSVEPPRLWPTRLAAAALVMCLAALTVAITRRDGLYWPRVLASAAATLHAGRYAAPATTTAAATATATTTAAAGGGSGVRAAAAPQAPQASPDAQPPPVPQPPRAASHPAGVLLPVSAAPARPARAAGRTASVAHLGVAFAASHYAVDDNAPAARLVVRRTGRSRGNVRFVWWTVPDSAKADVDYAPLGLRTELIPSGQRDLTIYVPIISNPLRHKTATFYVALGPADASDRNVPVARASVTIERGD
ncbi:MAG TPA: protein kinase [Steroidobacteraceae bacterium]|nr:protein kinase [Steroidobacteraceae bacterium]